MSSEKVQSVIPPPEALECSLENHLAQQAAVQENICIDKPEYHHNTAGQICEPEPVVAVEYVEDSKSKTGFREIVRLDEEKVLERQAQRFQETRPAAREPAPNRTEQQEQHLEAEAGQLHNLPHPHGEEEALPPSAAPVSPLGEAQILPPVVLAGADLCYCFPAETSSVETRRNPDARGVIEGEPVEESDPQASAQAVFESNLPVLGAVVLFQEVQIAQTVMEGVFYEEGSVTGCGFPASQVFYQQISQEMTETRMAVLTEDPPSAQPPPATARSPVETVVHSARHSFQYFALQIESPSNFPLSVSQQGGVALFVLEGKQTSEHVVIVLPPSALPADQVRSSSPTPPSLHGKNFSFSRVNGGSDSQGSGERHPGQDGRQHRPRH